MYRQTPYQPAPTWIYERHRSPGAGEKTCFACNGEGVLHYDCISKGYGPDEVTTRIRGSHGCATCDGFGCLTEDNKSVLTKNPISIISKKVRVNEIHIG